TRQGLRLNVFVPTRPHPPAPLWLDLPHAQCIPEKDEEILRQSRLFPAQLLRHHLLPARSLVPSNASICDGQAKTNECVFVVGDTGRLRSHPRRIDAHALDESWFAISAAGLCCCICQLAIFSKN